MDNVARFVAQIQANVRNFERNVKKAQALATALPNEIETDVDADISKFRRGILQAEALAKRFSARDIVKRIRVITPNFKNLYHSFSRNFTDPFNRRMGELAENIRTFGTVFSNMIKGSLIASFSALVPIIAGATSAVMALGNSLGVVAGNLLGFVGALGVAGLGVAAYGGLVASVLARYNDEAFEATESSDAFTRSLDSIKGAWSGIVDQNIDKIFMQMGQAIYGAQFALEGLTPFINDVVESMTDMTNSFKDFMKESPTMLRFYDNMSEKGSTVFESVIKGLGQFGKGLVDMVNAGMPLIESVASGFENMGTKFAEWADRMAENDGFKSFTEYVNENMPKISSIFGDAFNGIIDLFAAFGENSSTVLDGLVDMMERFREWSATIEESDGFQKFIDFIQTNGPVVVSIIGNIVGAIVGFGIAIAPLAEKVLELVDAFTEWLDKLMETSPTVGMVVGVITTLFGILMALAAPFLVLLSALELLGKGFLLVTRLIMPVIRGFISLLTNARLVNAIMWILRGAMIVLSGTVGVVIGVLVALVAIFIILYQEVEWFRNVVNTVWTYVSNFIKERVDLIIETFNGFREEGQGIFEALWNTIVTIVSEGLAETWLKITTWVTETLEKLRVWGEELGENMKTALALFVLIIGEKLIEAKEKFTTWVTETIEKIIEFKDQLIENIRLALAGFALMILTKLIEAKESFTTWVSETIDKVIEFGAQLLENIRTSMEEFKTAIQTKLSEAAAILVQKFTEMVTNARNKATEIANTVRDKFTEVKTNIENKMNEAKTALINKFTEMVTNARNKATEIVTAVRDKFTEIKTTIQNKMTEAKNELVNKMTEMVTNARNKAQEVYNGIKEKISEVPSMVGEIISDAASAVSEKASEFVSAGKDLILGLVEGIKSAAGDAVEAAKGVASDAIAGAKRMLGINSPSRVFRSFGEYTMQGLEIGINRMASRAVGAVTDVAKDMTDSFAPDLTTTADIDGQIGNFNRELRSTVDADIQSGIETQRPQVNVTVRNEGDVEMIRSYIQEEDGIDESLAF